MIDSLYNNFKHWSDNGSVYIISDTHFDDPDSKLMDPSWPNAQEQVDILKKYITKNDTLIHLGDVGNVEWIKKLKCYKVLIMGNHDVGKSKYLRFIDIRGDTRLFDEVYEGPLMIGEKILLSHEPILGLDWCINIHGHDHNGTYIDDKHINLASNICKFIPLSLGKFIKDGGLKEVSTIHRQTIDRATERKLNHSNEKT